MFVLLLACAATIRVETKPTGADVYVVQASGGNEVIPTDRLPAYIMRGTSPFTASVAYYAWNNYYVWVDAPGYRAEVMPVPNEPKVAPIVGGIFCLFPFIWSMGPTDSVLYVDLEKGVGPEDR